MKTTCSMKTKFNEDINLKEIQFLKKSQIEIKLEIKNSVSEMKKKINGNPY